MKKGKVMTKKVFLLILSASLSFGASLDTPTRTGEFPAEQMKAQNAKIVKLVTKEIKKTLPQTVDKYTTLTDIEAKGTTLLYTFELNTGAKSDESVAKEDRSRMKRAVTVGVCQSSSKFLEAGINTSYSYISAKTKVKLFRFDISQKDCTGLVH